MQFFPFGFDKGEQAGSAELLGGKGAGLVWLANEGVPVPPGFVIPTSVWAEYDQKPKATMKAIAKALPAYLAKLEAHFGYMPLLSVRSGARVSCPGMMDTILNVGIEESNIAEWVKRLGPQCYADSFARLVQMYGSVVKGLRKESLEGDLKTVLDSYREQTGDVFPQAQGQLLNSIEAVFKSWDNDRAAFYRKDNGYDRSWGTAVTVQAMVFGNLNEQSGTGVLFTRNPNTGVQKVTGEFLPNAQGEDIVAGIKTPLPLDEMKSWNGGLHAELLKLVTMLEAIKREMLDIEFTVQDGTLYLLQVRTGKRTPQAAIRIATDMAKQGMIDAVQAVKRVSIQQFDQAQAVQLDPKFTKEPAFLGLSACSGVVTGKPVFTKEDAIKAKEPVILVREETTPEDIAGMKAAVGIVTMKGGTTSHAAVNSRGMNRACIVGVGASLDLFKDVETLSLDGATGRIWTEKVPVIKPEPNGLIRDFNAMVCDALNVTPVIFDVPTYPMSEALLYLGDRVLDPQAAAKLVIDTLKLVNKLYLDLVPSENESRFMSIVRTHDHTGRVLNLLQSALPEDHMLFDRLTVIAKPEYSTTFRRIALGADLRNLVLSEEIALNGVDTSDPAIKRVLAWKVAEGKSVVSIGTYVPDAKSMISITHALQILGEV